MIGSCHRSLTSYDGLSPVFGQVRELRAAISANPGHQAVGSALLRLGSLDSLAWDLD